MRRKPMSYTEEIVTSVADLEVLIEMDETYMIESQKGSGSKVPQIC